MENSASYVLLEEMLLHRQLQMKFSEFEKLVDFMKLQELITAQEQQAKRPGFYLEHSFHHMLLCSYIWILASRTSASDECACNPMG